MVTHSRKTNEDAIRALILKTLEAEIRQKKESFSDADLFSALMGAIGSTLGRSEGMPVDHHGNTLVLIKLCNDYVPRVSDKMKSFFFKSTLALLPEYVNRFDQDWDIMWNILKLFSKFLIAHIEVGAPSDGKLAKGLIKQALRMLLHFCGVENDRVRKISAVSVSKLLESLEEHGSEFRELLESATSITLEYILRALQKRGDAEGVFVVLILAVKVFPSLRELSPSSMGQIEEIVDLLMDNAFIQTPELHSLACRALSCLDFRCLIDNFSKISAGLRDVDSSIKHEYYGALLKMLKKIADHDGTNAFLKLSNLAKDFLEFLGSDELQQVGTRTDLKRQFNDVMSSVIAASVVGVDKAGNPKLNDILAKFRREVFSCFNPHTKRHWNVLLSVLNSFLVAVDDEETHIGSLQVISRVLFSSSSLYSTASAEIKETMNFILRLLNEYGVEKFLERFPLVDKTSPYFTVMEDREWLIQEIKKSSGRWSLEFFWKQIRPLAQTQSRLSKESTSNIKYHLEYLHGELWSLFVPVCRNIPTDLETYFRVISPELRIEISSCDASGHFTCEGLSELITAVRTVNPHNQTDFNAIKRESKEFLKVLLSSYDTCPLSMKSAMNRLISEFLSICSSSTINSLFKSYLKRLLEVTTNDSTPATSGAMEQDGKGEGTRAEVSTIEVLSILVPFIDKGDHWRLDLLYRSFKHRFTGERPGIRGKKIYKLLFTMIHFHELWAQKMCSEILNLFFSEDKDPEAVFSSTTAKSSFIDILRELSPMMTLEQVNRTLFIGISSMKGSSVKTRDAGTRLLLTLKENPQMGGIENLVIKCAAGLGSINPRMISATIAALSKLLQEFRGNLPPELQESLASSILMLAGDGDAEIARAAMTYVKFLVASWPNESLLEILPSFLETAGKHVDSSKQIGKLRMMVKELLDRFCRKLGYEELAKNCDKNSNLYKILVKIRRDLKRTKAKKRKELVTNDSTDHDIEAGYEEEEVFFDDDWGTFDSGEEFDFVSAEPIIAEDSGEPINFLDTSSARKIGSIRRKLIESNDDEGGNVYLGDKDEVIVENLDENVGNGTSGSDSDMDAVIEAVKNETRPSKRKRDVGSGERSKSTGKKKFKSKKGDKRKPNDLEPYSYIPLSRKGYKGV